MPYKVAEVNWRKEKIEFILGEPPKEGTKVILLYTEEEHPSFIKFTQLAKMAKEKKLFSHILDPVRWQKERRNEWDRLFSR